jgi:hypothetical protein
MANACKKLKLEAYTTCDRLKVKAQVVLYDDLQQAS